MTIADIAILALATWRLQSIWLTERIAQPVRSWLSARGGWLAYLAQCPLCISVWVGMATASLWLTAGLTGRLLVVAFAASSGAILLGVVWSRLAPTQTASTPTVIVSGAVDDERIARRAVEITESIQQNDGRRLALIREAEELTARGNMLRGALIELRELGAPTESV